MFDTNDYGISSSINDYMSNGTSSSSSPLSSYADIFINDGSNAGGGFNPASLGQFASLLPMAGNLFGGGNKQQPQGKTFIPMQNTQMQMAKSVNPILDKGIAKPKNLYNYLAQ